MKTTVAVCVTLIGMGLAASQLPYLTAQDGPPADVFDPPPAPTLPVALPVPSAGVPVDVPPSTSLLPQVPTLSSGQQLPQPPMIPPLTGLGSGQGQTVVGHGLSTTGESPRQDGRVRMPGLAVVPAAIPVDPRLREMTEKYNQLEMEVMRLAGEFRRLPADAPEREETVKAISWITQQQFQCRHDARQLEIERLQKQLEDLQGKLRKREEKRDQIVQQRVEQLTDQKDELRWEPLEPAGAARHVPYGNAYSGWATPYPVQPFYGPSNQAQFPPSVREGQPPLWVPSSPILRAKPDPFSSGPAHWPAAAPIPSQVEGARVPVEGLSPPNGVAQSLLEAKVRLEAAEQEFLTLKAQFEAGVTNSLEMQRAGAERKMAEAALKAAQQQHDLQLKMRELDLRRAQTALEAAKAELEAQVELAGDRHDSVIDAEIRKAKANLVQLELDVARAEAMLQSIMQQGEEQNPEPTPETPPKF